MRKAPWKDNILVYGIDQALFAASEMRKQMRKQMPIGAGKVYIECVPPRTLNDAIAEAPLQVLTMLKQDWAYRVWAVVPKDGA